MIGIKKLRETEIIVQIKTDIIEIQGGPRDTAVNFGT